MQGHAADTGAGTRAEGKDSIVYGFSETIVATVGVGAVFVTVKDKIRLARGKGFLADGLLHGKGFHAAVHRNIHGKGTVAARGVYIKSHVVIGQVLRWLALVVLPLVGEKLRVHLQIEVTAGDVAVSALIPDKFYLLFGVMRMTNHYVRIFIGGGQVTPLHHLHAHIGQAGGCLHLVRLTAILRKAMHGEFLLGQEIRLVKAGTQRVAMVGHQLEVAGVQFNGRVLGLGIGVTVQAQGPCIVYLHLKIVQGREIVQVGFGIRAFL